jgi:hypothetical protein
MTDDKTDSGEGDTSESSGSESEVPPVTTFGGRVVHNSKPDSESSDNGEDG